MNKNLKILAVLVGFTIVTYIGIEPYAHHVFNPTVAPSDFAFSDIYTETGTPKLTSAEVNTERERLVSLIDNGDAENGEAQFAVCMGCHSLSEAIPAHVLETRQQIEAYGLVPPDLSLATLIYDEPFLIKYILNPNHAAYKAAHAEHQAAIAEEQREDAPKSEAATIDENAAKAIMDFDAKVDTQMSLMMGLLPDEQSAADLLAYLRQVASTRQGKPTSKEIVIDACSRCHSVAYDKVEAQSDPAKLQTYLGMEPPDLSVMIKSKGSGYLNTLINDPQKHLLGTTMPRVGLTKESQEKVVDYLDAIGDPTKHERSVLGVYFVGYFLLMAVLAYAWKHNEFDEMEDDDNAGEDQAIDEDYENDEYEIGRA